jgi:transcriptional regulator with XRE-family HTH domain
MTKRKQSDYADIPDVPPNPIVALRKTLGYTQEQLARELRITSQTVRRAEQGTYAHPPASIAEWHDSFETTPPNLLNLDALYKRWRTLKRQALKEYVPNDFDALNDAYKGHPFTHFRHRMMANFGAPGVDSVVGFCKLVCLEPKVVSTFEASYSMFAPEEITLMLNEVGYSQHMHSQFDRALRARRTNWLRKMNSDF